MDKETWREGKDENMNFSYGRRFLFLSKHALRRMMEQAGCFDPEEATDMVKKILENGFESRFNYGPHKETTISHKDLCLHIKENTITTVTYNYEYGMAV
jgi:hypothetical protein